MNCVQVLPEMKRGIPKRPGSGPGGYQWSRSGGRFQQFREPGRYAKDSPDLMRLSISLVPKAGTSCWRVYSSPTWPMAEHNPLFSKPCPRNGVRAHSRFSVGSQHFQQNLMCVSSGACRAKVAVKAQNAFHSQSENGVSNQK
ncbi:hypothetical protein CDAR_167201 [Caerostris darwini]|uniref:Uncharacterized protein n=1 Tax=Caerostris darwini TaxID=1538125 RepID=A0AAV4X7S8_9ARAC|nr:hypothetical protein CDAR_167201 [Caerostris darwini]